MRDRIALTCLLMSACAAMLPGIAQAQAMPSVVLEIDFKNWVIYEEDTFDLSKYATNPNITPASAATFGNIVGIADIVSVNGQPAKGTWTILGRRINLSTTSTPGQATADVSRQSIAQINYEIQSAAGTPIGTLMAAGLGGTGAPPPGAPLAQANANTALVGGTGAFIGIQGTSGGSMSTAVANVPFRLASMVEDPAMRRQNGGGSGRQILVIIPSSRPQVLITANGPAIAHASDFTTVSGSKPAAPGEILALVASGLGPTRAGVDPGQPFPTAPLAVVNSPVTVTVNGKPAEVLGAVGYPGAVDAYQVNFRVPPDTAKGSATIQVIAAWIPGQSVNIIVQ